MKSYKLFILSLLMMISVFSGFAFTPQSDMDLRNFYAIYNATDICVTGGICLSSFIGSDVNKTYVDTQDVLFNDSMKLYVDSIPGSDVNKSYVDSQDILFNTSMKLYVDFQNILFNNSMKTYVDGIPGSDVNKSYVDSQDILFNASMKVYVDSQDIIFNDSIKLYVDSQDILFNDSMKLYVDSVSGSDINKSYVDSQDILFNSSMKTYVDGTFITLANEQNLVINWTQLQNYPSACPADSFVTQVGDTITCTGVSDVYLLNNGDTATGNYVFSGGTFDVDSLNTGQGDYELYGMDQDVLTSSSPTFVAIDANLNGSQVNAGIISSSYIQDSYLLNTGDTASGNYTFSNEIESIERIRFEADTVNHIISDNATCVIITGDTSTFNIC